MMTLKYSLAGLLVFTSVSSSAVAAAKESQLESGPETRSITPGPSAPASAAVCVGCHGERGLSANPLWPNLAGQKRDYLVKQLKAFKSQERSDPMMSAIVQTLSDSDIETLSHYYSALK